MDLEPVTGKMGFRPLTQSGSSERSDDTMINAADVPEVCEGVTPRGGIPVRRLLSTDSIIDETPRMMRRFSSILQTRSFTRVCNYAAGSIKRRTSGGSDISLTKVAELEWYMRSASIAHFLQEQYYYCYAGYLVMAVVAGTTAFKLADAEMDLWDAFFSAACSVSQSGLSSLDWSKQTSSVHVISIILMFLGSMPLLTLWPVLLRRNSFRQQMRVEGDRVFSSQSKTRSLQMLEYDALGKCVILVIAQVVVFPAVGFCIITTYSLNSEKVALKLEEYGITHWWHSLYLTVSAYQNNGLTLTPSSVEAFNDQAVPLLVVSFLILVGNTCFPIVMRLLAASRKASLPPGPDRDAYGFLLKHPRRCFTHMFPAVQTLWLCLVAAVLLFVQAAVFVQQNHDMPVLEGMSSPNIVLNGVFQAASSRTAGLNSVDINALSPSTTFILMVCMYISTSPTVVMMRYSATHKAAADLGIDGKPEGHDEEADEETETVAKQAKKHLYQHTTILTIITFLILSLEREKFNHSASISSEALYGDFTAYKVFFEIASAYGTVGLSLGYRSSPASFSSSFCRLSQVLLVWCMLLGRLRGLPESIDPSVALTMKMDCDDDEEEDHQMDFVAFSSPRKSTSASGVAFYV